jgi:hypothetical protein
LKQSFENVKLSLNECGVLEQNFFVASSRISVTWGQNFLLPQAEFLIAWNRIFYYLTEFLASWDRIFCCLKQNLSHGTISCCLKQNFLSAGTEFLIASGGISICGDCSEHNAGLSYLTLYAFPT